MGTAQDYTNFAAFAALVYVPLGNLPDTDEARVIHKIHMVAHGPVVWTMFDFFRNHYQTGDPLSTLFVVSISISLLIAKLWTLVAFGKRQHGLALTLIWLNFCTTLAVLSSLAIKAWLLFGLYFVYVIFTFLCGLASLGAFYQHYESKSKANRNKKAK